ncbi:TM2 domain-containing protein [Corynebacterium phocae]|uniref:TM2 domain-containing protein n=1 Tax=Corynebacterium phocae TaxID=161895 RepID=UPI0009FDABD3|nr:TM2 domain-containing protein [Corynebacterium phocae]KAA8725945.1 NINE protein [Corynebacterium phocae]
MNNQPGDAQRSSADEYQNFPQGNNPYAAVEPQRGENPWENPQQHGAAYPAVAQYQQGVQPHSNYQPPQQGFGVQPSGKSFVVAAVLAFFLGGFGVHNFFVGYNGRGVAQLLLTLFGSATAFLVIGVPFLMAVGLWVLIDFVMILLGTGAYRRDTNGDIIKR